MAPQVSWHRLEACDVAHKLNANAYDSRFPIPDSLLPTPCSLCI
ncbi:MULTISPECIES: hypothetical protein [Moorena]|nr:hypothetical protein [Moorena sp. SIO4G3]